MLAALLTAVSPLVGSSVRAVNNMTNKKSWFKTKWASWVAQATLVCMMVGQACSCSTPSDHIVEPVDAGPDAQPVTSSTTTFGQCWTRYYYVDGNCTPETETPECSAMADMYTTKAIRQTEHYSGGVGESYSDECPESHSLQSFTQTFVNNECTIKCAFHFDITQQFAG